MNVFSLILSVIFVISIKIVSRILAGYFDKVRVKRHIEKKGGKLISLEWEPFGSDWFVEDRTYRVVYLDKKGIEYHAIAKTSQYSSVYFLEDRIIEYNDKNIEYNEKSVFENIQETLKHNNQKQ